MYSANMLKFQFNKMIYKFICNNSTKRFSKSNLPFIKMIHNSISLSAKNPNPLKLAFASYEDTKTIDISKAANNPPLILMHGLFGSKGNWNSMCKVLQKRTNPTRKIIAVDARNHGDSPHDTLHTYDALAEDIKHLVTTERLGDKIALLGHSMGGRAMMLFALKWPEMVDRLIIADVSPISMSPGYTKMMKFFHVMQQIKIPNNLSMSKARLIADQFLSRQIADKGIRQFLLTNLVQNSDGSFKWRLNIQALLTNYVHIGSFPQFDGEKRYTGPTVFIAGGMSDYIQKSDYPEIKKLFPKAEFKSIEGAGHWVHSEKPHEFLDIVIEILNRESITETYKTI